jgi:hypothetical protein
MEEVYASVLLDMLVGSFPMFLCNVVLTVLIGFRNIDSKITYQSGNTTYYSL